MLLCKLSAGVSSTIALLFFTLALFSPHCLLRLCFYLKLWQIWQQSLPPLVSGYNGSLDIHFSRGMTRVMSWPGECTISALAIACSFSSLISRIHYCLFSVWRRAVSSKFFDTQVPSVSTGIHWRICALWSRSLCPVLSLLQQTQPSVECLPL